MSDTELSIFDDEKPAEQPEQEAPSQEEQPTEPEQAVEAEQSAEQPAETEEPGETQAAPPVADQKEEQHSVPITAMLDEREKRQKAEQQAEASQRQLQQLQAQMQQREQPKVDWFDDPAAAAQHQAQQVEQQMLNNQLNMSQFMAEREFGAEIVNETIAFCQQNPQITQQFLNQPSPYHAAVEFYKKQKFMSEIGNDPEAWKKQIEEDIRAQVMAEQPTPAPTPAPVTPPASLTKTPASGGNPNEPAVEAPKQLKALFG